MTFHTEKKFCLKADPQKYLKRRMNSLCPWNNKMLGNYYFLMKSLWPKLKAGPCHTSQIKKKEQSNTILQRAKGFLNVFHCHHPTIVIPWRISNYIKILIKPNCMYNIRNRTRSIVKFTIGPYTTKYILYTRHRSDIFFIPFAVRLILNCDSVRCKTFCHFRGAWR